MGNFTFLKTLAGSSAVTLPVKLYADVGYDAEGCVANAVWKSVHRLTLRNTVSTPSEGPKIEVSVSARIPTAAAATLRASRFPFHPLIFHKSQFARPVGTHSLPAMRQLICSSLHPMPGNDKTHLQSFRLRGLVDNCPLLNTVKFPFVSNLAHSQINFHRPVGHLGGDVEKNLVF